MTIKTVVSRSEERRDRQGRAVWEAPEGMAFRGLSHRLPHSAIPQQMVGPPNWPQFTANQNQANYMSMFMGQMFDQMSRMEDHLMGMNRQLLAQNNALVKKMLLDDRKKQSKNDTKKKIAQGWMDMMVH